MKIKTILWTGSKKWRWMSAIGDCLCEDCKKCYAFHPIIELNLAKIYEKYGEEHIEKGIIENWLAMFLHIQLRIENHCYYERKYDDVKSVEKFLKWLR